MAYTTINKSTEHFNTKLYTGNGSTQSITGVGFQPDWVWIKSRSQAVNHYGFDAVRGATKGLSQNITNGESTRDSTWFNSFDSDGFTIGSEANINNNSDTYASWNWKAGTTGSGTSTGSGTGKAYSYSVNTTAGFSIIKYKGNGTPGHTIPHHLGTTPDTIIAKRLSDANNWSVYHKDSFTSQAAPGVLYLNTTAGKANDVNVWGNSTVTIDSTVFSLGDYEGTNYNDSDYIAYCFAEKTGYSKFGSYTGNGNANGPFIYTGFKPAWVMIKPTSYANSWGIFDDKRPGYNVTKNRLEADGDGAENTNLDYFDFLSNGFKVRTSNGHPNTSSGTLIYMAFGQSLVGSNNVPCTAR